MSDQIHDAISCETSCTEPFFLAALFRTSSPNAKIKINNNNNDDDEQT